MLPKGEKKISVPFKDVLVTKKQHRRPVWSALTYIGKKSCNSVATLNFKCRRFSSLKWDLKEHWTILLPCKIYPIAFLLLVRDADLTYREFMTYLQREITVGIKGYVCVLVEMYVVNLLCDKSCNSPKTNCLHLIWGKITD